MSRAEEVRKLRESGMTIDSICIWFGACESKQRHEILSVCRKAGMPITDAEKQIAKRRQAEQFSHDEEWARHYIRDKSHGRFEYISGYINMDSSVLVRCTDTGEIIQRSMRTFRGNKHLTKARRRIRIKQGLIDKDITIDKLYDKDKGVCYICGGECDRNDIKLVAGYWIAGDRYPSIDHVKPLAKGGQHSWDNVRLAHYRCNVIKNDKWCQ